MLFYALFFIGAIAMAGLPPLSGFLGKLLLLDAAFASPHAAWIWAVVLVASLISIVGFARAGSTLFWKAQSLAPDPEADIPDEGQADPMPTPAPLAYIAVGGLIALLAAHTVFAGQVHSYTSSIAAQLAAPEPYIAISLDTPGKLSTPQEGY